MIAQSGIKNVVFEDNKYKDTLEVQISEKILSSCGVKMKQINVGELVIK